MIPLSLKQNCGIDIILAPKQLVRSADSVGANLAEGAGRGHYRDNRRFMTIARGALTATQHWRRRAQARNLLTTNPIQPLKPLIEKLAPKRNAYRNAITTMAHLCVTNNADPITKGPAFANLIALSSRQHHISQIAAMTHKGCSHSEDALT
ncbi:MAG: four helix bundle protein [Leptolyngbya sp. SIOISBB]|nr:four helix bundle protein [Leptolyngbya sp. SIOISBB]